MTDRQHGPSPTRRRLIGVALACAAMTLAGGAGAAQRRKRGSADPAGARRPGAIDADTAAAAVQARCRCRILGVTRGATEEGAPRWRVKVLLPQGRVRTVHVDASNGEVLD